MKNIGIKFYNIEDLEKMMTDEQKKEARDLYEKYYGEFKDVEPIYCGPEARAMAEGPEALRAYYKDCEKYLREVDLDTWNEEE